MGAPAFCSLILNSWPRGVVVSSGIDEQAANPKVTTRIKKVCFIFLPFKVVKIIVKKEKAA
jgi:hypothetical protein